MQIAFKPQCRDVGIAILRSTRFVFKALSNATVAVFVVSKQSASEGWF